MLNKKIKELRVARYNFAHKRAAKVVLNSIKKEKHLTNDQKKVCDDYSVSVLGGREFSPWLHVYTAMNGEFKEGWIPDNYWGAVVVPRLKGLYGEISRLKPLNQKFYNSSCFPDIASTVNNVFFDDSYQYIADSEVKDFLFSHSEEVVFKVDNSNQGRGIHIFSKDNFDLDVVKQLGNGLFQKKIQQHEALEVFTASSVATLRVTSLYKDDGEISILAAYLRLGRDSETHVKSNSHIRISVDINSGCYYDIGHNANWTETSCHPDSKVAFKDQIFPCFTESLRLVRELHKKSPYARVIGWDIAIDKNNFPVIMEWNGAHNDIKYSEATQGPIFKGLGFEGLWKS